MFAPCQHLKKRLGGKEAPVGFSEVLAEIISVGPSCDSICVWLAISSAACFIVSLDEVDFLIRTQLAASTLKDHRVGDL